MNLATARSGYEYHSGKASDVARQLGLAGIAIIWVFKTNPSPNVYVVPQELFVPAVLIVGALSADFLQYLTAAISWGWYTRWKEQQPEVVEDPDVSFSAPPQLNWPGNCFFALKLLLITLAYSFLLEFLIKHASFTS